MKGGVIMLETFKELLQKQDEKTLVSTISTITAGYVATGKNHVEALQFMENLYHQIVTSDEDLGHEAEEGMRVLEDISF